MLCITYDFARAHSIFSKKGMRRIKETFLASGAAASRSTHTNQARRLKRYSGWRFGSLVACWEVGICLTLNLIFLICALAVSHPQDGIGILFEGSCPKVKNIDTWLHVLLNGLATALLGASNYNMQCLASPNREEVDQAHAKSIALDIGIQSIKNLRYISRKRAFLWALLALSSLPLHLLWNSAIFSTLQDNSYFAVTVSADFLVDQSPNCEVQPTSYSAFNLSGSDYNEYYSVLCNLYTAARRPEHSKAQLTRLSFDECIRAYETPIQSKWSNVIAVLNLTRQNISDAERGTTLKVPPLFVQSVILGSSESWIRNNNTKASNFVNSHRDTSLNTCMFPQHHHLHIFRLHSNLSFSRSHISSLLSGI